MSPAARKFSAEFFKGSTPIVLVAGGAGFIGSHLCEKLLEKNLKVICVDNWLTGVKENVSHLLDNDSFVLLEQDIQKKLPGEVERVNYIVQLAGVEAYLNGEDVSIETLEANSIGTKNLLELARKEKAKFLLVSSIGVFSANISATSTSSYFGEGRVAEGEFSHHEAKRFAEALTSEYGQKHNVDVRIARILDAYGPRMMLSSGSIISELLKRAVYAAPLAVPGGEELPLFPVFIEDLVEGLERAVFGSGTKGKIISLTGPKTSAFSLAQTIKAVVSASPELSTLGKLEIEFVEKNFPQRNVTEEVLSAGRDVISWSPKTSLEEGLVNTISWFLAHKKRVPKLEKEKAPEKSFWAGILKKTKLASVPELKNPLEGKSKKKAFAVLVGSIIILWPFVSPFAQVAAGVVQLTLARNALLSADSDKALFWSQGATNWLKGAESGFIWWEKIPGLKNESRELARQSNILAQIAAVEKAAALALREGEVLVNGVFGEEPFDPQQPADRLALELGVLERNLAFLEAQLGTEDVVVDLPLIPRFQLSESLDLKSIRNTASALATILREAETLLGRSEKRTYILLFQNNMELRPTGGFIGSFSLVTFNRGRMVNMEVYDVYTADGQLKGHVEPPTPIREHLGEAAWYLRDSNWSPDFPTTARRVAWFIDKEMGEEVYGVVGVDLELAKELIFAYGPISLPDFNEEVTADNLYEKTQYAVEGNFFPGSRAKKNYLTALSRALMQKIFIPRQEGKEIDFVPIARATFRALERRHMAVWVNNPQVLGALRQAGWDGSTRSIRCKNENCTADYLMLVEANLGVNKANHFIERNYSLELSFKEGAVVHQLSISYKNNSHPGEWPGGDYRNYARVFVPAEANLVSARLTNPDTGDQQELEVDTEAEKGKASFGVMAVIPAQTRRQLSIAWETKLSGNLDVGELVLLWQKQMGTPADPVWVRINLPEKSSLSASNPAPSLTAPTNVAYNTELSEDLIFNLQWSNQP